MWRIGKTDMEIGGGGSVRRSGAYKRQRAELQETEHIPLQRKQLYSKSDALLPTFKADTSPASV